MKIGADEAEHLVEPLEDPVPAEQEPAPAVEDGELADVRA